MSSGISSASNSLAAELLLNKIQNGQVSTDSGKTVSAGSRVTSTALNLDAAQAAAFVPAVEEGATLAEVNQSKITAARDAVTTLMGSIQSTTDPVALKALGAELTTLISDTGMAGKNLKDAAVATTAQIGLDGGTVNINANETNLSTTALTTAVGKLTALTAASTDADIQTALTGLSTAAETFFQNLIAEEAVLGQKAQTLSSRSVLLNDLASTYSDGASNQVLQGAGGASDLLNNVLG